MRASLLLLILLSSLFESKSFRVQTAAIRRKVSLNAVNFNDVAETYQSIMANNGLLADMVTVLGTTSLSDFIAQSTEKSQSLLANNALPTRFDSNRLLRFTIFGFLDGAVGHGWFQLLDQVINGNGGIFVVEKIAADSLIYTPVWCFWFVSAMSVLKGNFDITQALKSEWKELLWIDLGFFLPLSCIVYSVVPLESRVTVFAVASVIYTVVVSLWNEQKKDGGKSFMTDIVEKK
eukprot:gene36140-46988_t